MSLQEKVAYLKGLSEGLGLDAETKEGKLFLTIIDTLSAMAEEIDELNENALDIGEELDAISDDLADVEEFLFDDDYNDDDFDDFDDFDDIDGADGDYEADHCDCAFCNGDDFTFQVGCPSCSAEIDINESDLINGSATCPSCGEELELEFDDADDDSIEIEKEAD